MKNNERISVVVPVYGCVSCLEELHRRLTDSLKQITTDFEMIFVNDASPDHSWDKIEQLVKKDDRVVGINLSRNFGQHYAITAGLDYSSGDWIVVMDCDLQDQPEEIEKLYTQAKEGFDIVLGRRANRNDTIFKKLSSKLFYKVFSYLTETEQDGTVANFGIYHTKVISALLSMRENLRFFPTMVKWVGFKSTTIDIQHSLRIEGNSSYSLKKLLKLAFNVMIAFSDKPLRLTVGAGFMISFFSFIYALYIVIRDLMGIKAIQGWPSLIVSIWFLSGLIIFVLGIIGIYLGKAFDEVKKRPIYIVKDTIKSTKDVHQNSNNTVQNGEK
ncbi:dolichol-phosphate mannosyltransferase [Bacillus mesophilus]|uniref:Glycosyltransferase n=1 Tax=Bacillus mesophilus TaxID=1808955 RepID=A0A6M0QA05_9BACI|nr:glycosyltransferase [Bacillus mesophilus]MBM7661688.1 dolichol-phosphate mannosyltransferase [Bacillus mesophilus]NEY72350.1 glycosyltransferase [Bacillus mesophilus]